MARLALRLVLRQRAPLAHVLQAALAHVQLVALHVRGRRRAGTVAGARRFARARALRRRIRFFFFAAFRFRAAVVAVADVHVARVRREVPGVHLVLPTLDHLDVLHLRALVVLLLQLLVDRREVLHGARHVVDLVVPALQVAREFPGRRTRRVRVARPRGGQVVLLVQRLLHRGRVGLERGAGEPLVQTLVEARVAHVIRRARFGGRRVFQAHVDDVRGVVRAVEGGERGDAIALRPRFGDSRRGLERRSGRRSRRRGRVGGEIRRPARRDLRGRARVGGLRDARVLRRDRGRGRVAGTIREHRRLDRGRHLRVRRGHVCRTLRARKCGHRNFRGRFPVSDVFGAVEGETRARTASPPERRKRAYFVQASSRRENVKYVMHSCVERRGVVLSACERRKRPPSQVKHVP